MTDTGDARPSTDLFRAFADEAVPSLPLYRRLCTGAARDSDVADRLLLSPRPTQRVPTLLLAAVHDTVLAGDDHPDAVALGQWYTSVTDPPRPVGRGVDDPWPHFRELALNHPRVAERLRTGATQTNEVGRCAPLVLALATMPEHRPRIGLIEIGPSAGLNLLLDRYGYRFERSGRGVEEPADIDDDVSTVDAEAALVLSCSWRGAHRPPVPDRLPSIAHRAGLDREPVDVGDPDQARWLVACQWPDQPERVRRARAAIALSHADRPTIVTGDAVDDLAPLVESAPDDVIPVVVSTWVLSYLEPARQQQLLAVLDDVAAGRDLSMVFAEQPVEVDGMSGAGVLPARPDGRPDGPATALVRIDWRGGERRAHRLADQHPHGTWIEWLGGG